MNNERDSMRKNSLTLGAVALITATLLATTYHGTKDKIETAQRELEQKTLLEIIPVEQHSNDLLLDTEEIPEHFWPTLGLPKGGKVHIARDENGAPSAVIFPTIAPDGYSGKIKMIIGLNIDGSIAGVRITEHGETPGLGDKVDLAKSNWVLDFDDKSLGNPPLSRWAVKKDGGDFDQFTGATITPRAVINQISRALRYFQEDKDRLIQKATRNQSGIKIDEQGDSHGN